MALRKKVVRSSAAAWAAPQDKPDFTEGVDPLKIKNVMKRLTKPLMMANQHNRDGQTAYEKRLLAIQKRLQEQQSSYVKRQVASIESPKGLQETVEPYQQYYSAGYPELYLNPRDRLRAKLAARPRENASALLHQPLGGETTAAEPDAMIASSPGVSGRMLGPVTLSPRQGSPRVATANTLSPRQGSPRGAATANTLSPRQGSPRDAATAKTPQKNADEAARKTVDMGRFETPPKGVVPRKSC